ncbi:MAG: SDR family NAD(P)-dependent oxidoreductase [Bacteroidetes bacterium]|nr:SDR family NAD(P)-dependent oxidoreductase [Bacteroidota bacterium]
MNLSDARIIVTGGARGIGNFLATHLATQVAHVFIIDNNKELLDALSPVPNITALHCDITNPETVQVTLQKIFKEQGGANVCINNAGIIHSEPLINLLSRPDKKHNLVNWQRVIDVNLNAVFYMGVNFADQLISSKGKGLIINISSIAAQGNVGQSAYSASKAAVEALTKTWSKELGMFKIRCACIAPGFFDTPSTRESVNEHMLDKWKKNVPLAKLGDLTELLSAAKFIIENEYFNGKILALDGGLTI